RPYVNRTGKRLDFAARVGKRCLETQSLRAVGTRQVVQVNGSRALRVEHDLATVQKHVTARCVVLPRIAGRRGVTIEAARRRIEDVVLVGIKAQYAIFRQGTEAYPL